MVEGVCLCVCGEVCGGFFGVEMVYLIVCVVVEDELLFDCLILVYLSMVGVVQVYLCKVILNVFMCMLLLEMLLNSFIIGLFVLFKLMVLVDVVCLLYQLMFDVDEYSFVECMYLVWLCIKFDELLLQQLLFKCVQVVCWMCNVFVLCDSGKEGLFVCFMNVLLFKLIGVQVCVWEEICVDFVYLYLMQ